MTGVHPDDVRHWVQLLTIRGRRCELGLVSLAKVREQVLANRRLAQAGGDPLGVKCEADAVLTFVKAAGKVHALHLPTWRNARCGAQVLFPGPKAGKPLSRFSAFSAPMRLLFRLPVPRRTSPHAPS